MWGERVLEVPVGPAAVFTTILIAYFVMTVWYGQARNAPRPQASSENEKPVARKAG